MIEKVLGELKKFSDSQLDRLHYILYYQREKESREIVTICSIHLLETKRQVSLNETSVQKVIVLTHL